MFRIVCGLVVGLMLAGQAAAQAPAPAAPLSAAELKEFKAKVSYLFGRQIGQSLKENQMDVDMDVFVRALREGAAGAQSVLSESESEATFQAFQSQMQAKQAESMKTRRAEMEAKMLAENPQLKADHDKNAAAGAAFLAENGKKEGIVTLPSGVQYKVIKAGTGATPKASDTVTAHYAGRLLDGTKFDSSYDRGQPLVIPVGGVIPGWTEVLQKMKVGDKWEVYIPGTSAYGVQGSPPTIGPGALLIFEMELIAIEAGELPQP